MTTKTFTLLFLVFFFAEFALSYLLNFLNSKSIRSHKDIPQVFSDTIDLATYQKSQDYSLVNLRFSNISMLYANGISLALLFSGILPWWNKQLGQYQWGTLSLGVAFLISINLVPSLLNLPFSLYRTFKIEAQFGFNTTSLGLFFKDMIKGLFISMLIGIPFLYAILWFLNTTGQYWWIWTFAFITGFQAIMMVIYPIFIAPFFNKFTPLEDGELKDCLLKLAEDTQFPACGIFVMDGSRRSKHANAYFTGFGKLRRIVLYDTLIKQMTTAEIKAVLAHEIGHYKHKHIYKMLITSTAMTALTLWLMSVTILWQPLHEAFGFVTPTYHVGLFLFFTALSTFTFFTSPLHNHFSRKHEYEADAYAAKACQDKISMQSALKKLSEKNLSNLTPHAWYSFFHYSHPSTIERIDAIQAIELQHPAPTAN